MNVRCSHSHLVRAVAEEKVTSKNFSMLPTTIAIKPQLTFHGCGMHDECGENAAKARKEHTEVHAQDVLLAHS